MTIKFCCDCTHSYKPNSKKPCLSCHVDVLGVPSWTPKEGAAPVAEPRDERLDWELDKLLVVTSDNGDDYLRHFAGVDDGMTVVFTNGYSSLQANHTTVFYKSRPATPADIERLRPKLPEWCAKPKGGA